MRIDRDAVPPLYALTAPLDGLRLSALVLRLAAAGIRWIQVREKLADDLNTLHELLEIRADATIFVNDRVDLAVAGMAAGVHLGDRDLPAAAARRIAGDALLIGVSTHSLEAVAAAEQDGAVDYIALGPIFPSPTKDVRAPLGLDLLTAARSITSKPLVAIGGIDATNIADVLSAGADSAAVISALYGGGRIEQNVAQLLHATRRA